MSSQNPDPQRSSWTPILTGLLAFAFGIAAVVFPANIMFGRILDVILGRAKPLSGSMTAVAALLALVALDRWPLKLERCWSVQLSALHRSSWSQPDRERRSPGRVSRVEQHVLTRRSCRECRHHRGIVHVRGDYSLSCAGGFPYPAVISSFCLLDRTSGHVGPKPFAAGPEESHLGDRPGCTCSGPFCLAAWGLSSVRALWRN